MNLSDRLWSKEQSEEKATFIRWLTADGTNWSNELRACLAANGRDIRIDETVIALFRWAT